MSMFKGKPVKIILVSSVALMCVGVSMARQAPEDGSRPAEERTLPPEAFTACASSKEGDACQVSTPRGEETGVCSLMPEQTSLACKLDRPARGGRGGSDDGSNSGGPPKSEFHAEYVGKAGLSPENFSREGRLTQTGSQDAQNRQGNGNQNSNEPPTHRRTITQTPGPVKLVAATEAPIAAPKISSSIEGEFRIIKSNAIAEHNTGLYPNPGNPNQLSEQEFELKIPADPVYKGQEFRAGPVFGIAINGVPLDPGANEFYKGDRSLGWDYNALSGALDLGFDVNYAHVQPTGKYHYHGMPTGLLASMDIRPDEASPIMGWAKDGFPIYALYSDNGLGAIVEAESSYRLKVGERPSSENDPGGVYDGTFNKDYMYVEGLGDLDACNGKLVVSDDFPNGTYGYFITREYPYIPRCYQGERPKRDAGMRGPQGPNGRQGPNGSQGQNGPSNHLKSLPN